jgi:hypothetical protein
MEQLQSNYRQKYSTHLALDQFEEDVRLFVSSALKLNRYEAQDALNGSEDVIAANWWNQKSVTETGNEILRKTL